MTQSGHCPKRFGGEFLQDSEPRASSREGPVLEAKSFLGKRRAARSGQDRRLLQFSRGLPPPCPLGEEGGGIVKSLGQGSSLGWLNRHHGPILTTTLPVVPSPADLLVA